MQVNISSRAVADSTAESRKMVDEILNIVISKEEELDKLLKKLEYKGYVWNTKEKPTGWKPSCPVNSIQIWKDKTITWNSNKVHAGCKNITVREFLAYKEECIVIYRKGNETIALYKRTGKKAVAKCSPDDTYDFMTGAKMAFDRLIEPEEEKPEFKPHLEWLKINYGNIGDKTPFKDAIGRELRVGDTVELYDEENNYKGENVVVYENGISFICGILVSCEENGTIKDGWKIILKRKHEDVKNGETVDDIMYIKKR